MSKSWYVVNSYSGYENKAKEQLLERIERENLHEFFGGIEVPTQTITEMKAGKEKVTEKKFFPGYVLVQMEMNDETWHLVKETPRVLGFIGGTKNNPKPISFMLFPGIKYEVSIPSSLKALFKNTLYMTSSFSFACL